MPIWKRVTIALLAALTFAGCSGPEATLCERMSQCVGLVDRGDCEDRFGNLASRGEIPAEGLDACAQCVDLARCDTVHVECREACTGVMRFEGEAQ